MKSKTGQNLSKDKRKDDVIMNEMITTKEVRCTSDERTNLGNYKHTRCNKTLRRWNGLRFEW